MLQLTSSRRDSHRHDSINDIQIPDYEDKYGPEVPLSPEEVVAEQGDGLPDVPPAVILGYQPKLTEVVEDRGDPPIQIVRAQ